MALQGWVFLGLQAGKRGGENSCSSVQRCPGLRPVVPASLAQWCLPGVPPEGTLACAGNHRLPKVCRHTKPLSEAHHALSNFPVMPVCTFQLSPQLPQVLTEGPCTLVPGLGALPAHPQWFLLLDPLPVEQPPHRPRGPGCFQVKGSYLPTCSTGNAGGRVKC